MPNKTRYRLQMSEDTLEDIIEEIRLNDLSNPRKATKTSRFWQPKKQLTTKKISPQAPWDFANKSIGKAEKRVQICLAISGCLFFGGSLFLLYAFLCRIILTS